MITRNMYYAYLKILLIAAVCSSLSAVTAAEISLSFQDTIPQHPQHPGHSQTDGEIPTLSDIEATRMNEGRLLSSVPDNQIKLFNGWNYISVPQTLLTGYDTAGVVFDGIDTAGHAVFEYDASNQYWVLLNADSLIRPLDGIVIYSNGIQYVTLTYQTPPNVPSKAIYAGWNLIGFFDPLGNVPDGYVHAAYAREFLAPVESWIKTQGFDANQQAWEPYIYNSVPSNWNLMFPKKGYWLYSTSQDTLVHPITHRYYGSIEWVNDYPGTKDDLQFSDDEAIGFKNSLDSDSYWDIRFCYGDDTTPKANESHWKNSSDNQYVDNSNFAYFSGHGDHNGFGFGDGTALVYDEALWGEYQLDWIALSSCRVLNRSYNTHWDPAFEGLHAIVGWDSEGYQDSTIGSNFASQLRAGCTVWDAWKNALNSAYKPIYGPRNAAILAADADGDNSTYDCLNDHIYGHGSWMTPPINPSMIHPRYEQCHLI